MKLKIYIILTTILILAYYLFINNKKNLYHIAILQSCSHKSLGESREGFIKEIRSKYPENKIKISYFNGEGSISHIHGLAQQLTSNQNIDAFYAIGSIPAQNIYTLEKERPIFVTAISDPIAIGIHENSSNVLGMSDGVETETPFYIIHNTVPNAKKIGLIYSNAALHENEAGKIKKNLEANGKTVLDIIVQNEGEISSVLDNNLSKIDALFSLCDNIVASTIPLIAKKTISAKIPFIACFNDATKNGALASCGTNYYEDGKLAAQYAIQIMNKEKKPNEIGIRKNKNRIIYVNKETAAALNITINKNENIILI